MITLLHLSDLHLCSKKTGWDSDRILKCLIDDLKKMEVDHGLIPDAILITGDMAYGQIEKESIFINDQFLEAGTFIESVRLSFSRAIPKNAVFLVPGNHDVVRSKILDSQTKYIDTYTSGDFIKSKDAINCLIRDASGEWPPLMNRLASYRVFIENQFPHLLQDRERLCYAEVFEINGVQVGVAGLNSAWSCGREHEKGKLWLAGHWQINELSKKLDRAQIRLALSHHPLSWLVPQENPDLDPLFQQQFDLYFHGHEHHAWVDERANHVRIAAGACYGKNPSESGYSFVRLDLFNGYGEVWLRRFDDHGLGWIPRAIFGKTNNDGMWPLNVNWLRSPNSLAPSSHDSTNMTIASSAIECNTHQLLENRAVDNYLSGELEDSLSTFSSQTVAWIDPVLSTHAEVEKTSNERTRTDVRDIIRMSNSALIKAPPQFGLTCLAKHLVQQAWRGTPHERWVYLDARRLKSNINSIKRAVLDDLRHTNHSIDDVTCIVVDSIRGGEKSTHYVLKAVCDNFPDKKVIAMQTVDVRGLLNSTTDSINRTFEVRYLWALSREKIRGLVSAYNEIRHVGDEDVVVSRLVSDMDTLNIHRTPLNCLTVLKASEVDFSESPVNRTEILGRVLFVLFNADFLPTYKARPDVKDCEFVLGYFCEQLIRHDNYLFSREQFIRTLSHFCSQRVMALEIDALFDVLHANHIVVPIGSYFCFRFTYWIYYFAAQRMYHDEDFARYIFSDTRHTRFPEIVEFYTGIDRRRSDALKVIAASLHSGLAAVNSKLGLPEQLNPYQYIQWIPTPKLLEEMQNEIADGVAASNLPDVIKDRYADRTYDRSRPYDQSVREAISADTLGSVMLSLSAAARALRNSDYVDPDCKHQLFQEIVAGWKQIQMVLWVLLPLLSEHGNALIDGTRFITNGDFGKDAAQRLRAILIEIPYNIIYWYQNDLYSQKMAPLLFRQISAETDEIIKHNLIILLIYRRPVGWKESLQKYIYDNNKNSFYIFDVMRHLRSAYQYDFVNTKDLRDIEYLIKMCASKHVRGIDHPGKKAVSKIPDSVLPSREMNLPKQRDDVGPQGGCPKGDTPS